MGSRERERGRSGAVALRVLMAQQPRGSAMGAGLGRAVGSPRGLWEGEATDSRVCSPHAVSNRGIFVCEAVLTLLRAAACIRSLRSRGTLGAPQHQCCLPWGCWAGGAPIPLSCLPPGLCCVLHLGSLELRGPGSTAWAKLGHPRASVSPRGRGKNSSRDGTASVVVGGRCSDGDGDRIRLFPNPHPVLPAEHPWLCMGHPNDCPNAVRRRSGAVGCKADPCP